MTSTTGRAASTVDPQHLGEELLPVLAGLLRIAGGAAVAGADPQLAVAAELDAAAVVVGVRLIEAEDGALGRRIGAVRIVRVDRHLDHRVSPPAVGEVDVEAAVRREAGWNASPSRPRSS
jgi:hypothetical protein